MHSFDANGSPVEEFSGGPKEGRELKHTQDVGSNPTSKASNTWLYVLVRKELSGGALLAHVAHAAREALGPEPTEDERAVVLMATKAEIEKVIKDLETAKIPYKACIEVEGVLAGTTPSLGLAVADRTVLKDILGHLKPWRGK
jgi:hypothetical protein